MPAIHAYYLVPQIVGIPLLYFSLAAASCWLWRGASHTPLGLSMILVPVTLVFMFETHDWQSYLVSKSFMLSLILLLLTLPLLIEFVERPHIGCGAVRHATILVCLLAMLYAKISMGAIFAVGLYYTVLRVYGFSLLNAIKYAVPIGLCCGLVFRATVQSSGTESTSIQPFHFLNAYHDVAQANLIAIGLMLVAAALFLVYGKGLQRISVEALVVLSLAAAASGMLLKVGAGSAYYFLNVGVWVALAFGAGLVASQLVSLLGRPNLVAGGAAIVSVYTLLHLPQLRHAASTFAGVYERMEERVQMSRAESSDATHIWSILFSPGDTARTQIASLARDSVGGRVRDALVEAGLPVSRDTVVFVPPSNTAFWTMNSVCTAQPFLIPALIGVPMVDGLPPDKITCPIDPDTGFGYNAYPEDARASTKSDAELCDDARQVGFERVAILEASLQTQFLDCEPISGSDPTSPQAHG